MSEPEQVFLGTRTRALGRASWAGHVVTLAEYEFPCGTVQPYVEVEETHPHYTGSRILPLSTVVHALLNLGEMEVHVVGQRDVDFRGCPTFAPAGGVV